MNNQEAQFILLAYRANGADASDPQFRAALDQAQRDPELGSWLAEQRKFDLKVRDKLKAVVVPPPDLKSHLLALRDVVRARPWWQRPAWLGSIAVLLVGSAALILALRNPALPALRFADEMVQHASQPAGHLAMAGTSMQEITQWLNNRHVDGNFTLPPALSNMAIVGCQIVPCKGMSVAMICLKANGTNHVDVFLAPAAGFAEAVPSSAPQFQNSCHLTTAEWSTPETVYLVVGELPEEAVRKLVDPAKTPGGTIDLK
jgi:hypothetical protein